MRKKILFSMFAAVGLLAATSCQEEAIFTEQVGDEITATFALEAPQALNTRAIGDGKTVNAVACAVYDEDGVELTQLNKKDLPMADGKATYNIRLAKGQNYRVAFFAYNKEAGAYDVTDLKEVEILAASSNVEGRDAFTAYVDIAATTAAINQTVTLYRPFAQLNIGATAEDVAAAATAEIVVKKTQVNVSNVYTKFSAYNDAVVGDPTAVTFALNDVLNDKLMVEGTEYTYLALNYLLVGDKEIEKALTDVEFIWEAKNGKTNNPTTKFANVPVQRNYRTNIVGNLLTTPAEFNIVVDANFKEYDYIVNVWDGTKDEVTPAADVYEIITGAELAWVAEQTLAGNTFEGKTVKLMNDIDLNNAAWTPIGENVVNHPSHTFAGIFDGNGKTIFHLNATDNTPNHASAGLFGTITGEIKDLTIKDATITSSHYAGAFVGYITDGVTITNCHVDGATITSVVETLADGSYDNGDKVGGIVGYANSVNIEGCTVKNTTIQGYRDLGGIVGYFGSNGAVTNCQVLENVVINVDTKHNYKGYDTDAKYDANHIVGEGTADASNTGTATINYLRLEQVDLGLSVNYAPAVYGATDSNPYGTYMIPNEVNVDGYRLPTADEYEELLEKTISEKVTENGVEGYRFTSTTTGESIFMPVLPNDFAIEAVRGKLYVFTSTHNGAGYNALTDLADHLEVAGYWKGNPFSAPVFLVVK